MVWCCCFSFVIFSLIILSGFRYCGGLKFMLMSGGVLVRIKFSGFNCINCDM